MLCFEALLGLRVNFDKLELVLVSNVHITPQLANILGCMVSFLPMNNMGLLLGATSRAIAIWVTVIEKIKRKLVGWKILYLSKRGRITIIKSTGFNFTNVFLFTFPNPASVVT